MTVLLDAIGEALTNIAKHAGVGRAAVRVRLHPDTLEVTIADRGCGFAAATTGLGLRASIRGRLAEIGGTAVIESTPGDGTLIRLAAPRTADPTIESAPRHLGTSTRSAATGRGLSQMGGDSF